MMACNHVLLNRLSYRNRNRSIPLCRASLIVVMLLSLFTSCPNGTVINVTGVALDQAAVTLTVGDMLPLTVTVDPVDADEIGVSWSSSDETVVSVTEDGLVTAVAPGTATVTVTTADGGLTASCIVTVEAAAVAVTRVTLDETEVTLTAGNTQQLTATVTPADATDSSVTWSSDDETVASVSADGLVTAVASGTATVTVTTADGGFMAECSVAVEAKPTSTVNVTIE
jgi:large repetitive protein